MKSRFSRRTSPRQERGHALLIIVVMIAIMIISTTVAMKVWSTVIQREREEELIFRGKQYGVAIRLYQKMKGTLPSELKQLAEKGPNNESIIRQLYKDPITGQDFGLIYAGPNGRSEEHTSELQSQSHISYAVFCLKK